MQMNQITLNLRQLDTALLFWRQLNRARDLLIINIGKFDLFPRIRSHSLWTPLQV